MPDREKVINGLKSIRTYLSYVDSQVTDSFAKLGFYESKKDIDDAVALLKEQEAVEPTLIREGRNKYYNNYVCPRCDNDVVYEQNYCSECGARFLWE